MSAIGDKRTYALRAATSASDRKRTLPKPYRPIASKQAPLKKRTTPHRRYNAMTKPTPTEALVRARLAVDQIRLSRLATQNAIDRSRDSLAETRLAVNALKHAYLRALRLKLQRRIEVLKPTPKTN